MDQGLSSIGASLGYVDANLNGRIDGLAPDEPVYLDVDHEGTVSYGDVRLTAFLDAPAGSTVDVTNRDYGLRLAQPTPWFSSTPSGAWYIDADSSGSVSAGDVRVWGDNAPGKVPPGDALAGTALKGAQVGASSFNRLAIRDTNGNGRYDVGEVLYLDVDNNMGGGSGRVSPGDLRITPAGPYTDPLAVANDGTPLATGTANNAAKATPDSWRSLDWILVALAVANLAGFVILARQNRPKNPFT